MTAPPWMPLYVGDFLADTSHLSATDTGIYIRLLLHCWQHGSIPDDDHKLALIAHINPRLWHQHKETVLALFCSVEASTRQHRRITYELSRCREISNKRKAAALQKHSKSSANALQLHTHSHSNKNLSSIADSSERKRRSREGVARPVASGLEEGQQPSEHEPPVGGGSGLVPGAARPPHGEAVGAKDPAAILEIPPAERSLAQIAAVMEHNRGRDMAKALQADGEKLRVLTGENHGPWDTEPAATGYEYLLQTSYLNGGARGG